jgi:hypothetical protein
MELYGKIQSNDKGVSKVVGNAQFWNVTPATGVPRSRPDFLSRQLRFPIRSEDLRII